MNLPISPAGSHCGLCLIRPKSKPQDSDLEFIDRVLVTGLVVGFAAAEGGLSELETVRDMCPLHAAILSQAFAVSRVKQ